LPFFIFSNRKVKYWDDQQLPMNRTLLLFLIVAFLAYGCSTSAPESSAPSGVIPDEPLVVAAPEPTVQESAPPVSPLWISASLQDIGTGTSYSIGSFDKPVLVESFAVWCPICTRQQEELKQLHSVVGDSIVSVSLNSDPNEDQAKVREHIERHGFDWYYAVTPQDVTSSLIDQFGVSFVNVPLAPIVLLCPDGTAERLRNGVKSAEELQRTVTEQCGGI
jgi:thiol-disulfide isomerase/thioredoxin